VNGLFVFLRIFPFIVAKKKRTDYNDLALPRSRRTLSRPEAAGFDSVSPCFIGGNR
jgi:hypothetical protein